MNEHYISLVEFGDKTEDLNNLSLIVESTINDKERARNNFPFLIPSSLHFQMIFNHKSSE
ncbi:MAG: hypothetical protein HN826_03055 [Methylococcales bacterium]|jgi:hypothetical protein|nr:hypothetical protein [Methylococcales bacterium]